MIGPEIEKPAKARILMVDDHPIVREGMAQFLNAQADLDLCCEASTAEEALATLPDCDPALVIIDISLKKDSGLDLIKALRRAHPQLMLLAISQHEESIFAERALRAGANGYLMKQEATENILVAIRQVLAGNVYLSAAMNNRLSRRLAASQSLSVSPVAGLSEREFEILHLLGLGFSTREVAEKLNRSVKTIEAHRAHLKEKLQLRTGGDLILFAVQLAASTTEQ